MDVEILCGRHAPSKGRSLPSETGAAVLPTNLSEKKNQTTRNGAHGRSADCESLGDEEFSTPGWVRSRSGAASEASAKCKATDKSLKIQVFGRAL